MPQSTVLKAGPIRQATEHGALFEALAAFANLGQTPDDWRKFRLMWPDFFPGPSPGSDQSSSGSLRDWLYDAAEDWARFCTENSASLPPGYNVIPHLLWYRNLLRAIWMRRDPKGAALSALLGFEDQARQAGLEKVVPNAVRAPLLGLNRSFQTIDVMPQGRPIVEVGDVACVIRWEFGCEFQQAVYELMQQIWAAKVCPQCGKFFIANKPAQKFCSSICYGQKKASASLDFYHRKGRFLRQQHSGHRKSKTSRPRPA
jgi:hypothetical protein